MQRFAFSSGIAACCNGCSIIRCYDIAIRITNTDYRLLCEDIACPDISRWLSVEAQVGCAVGCNIHCKLEACGSLRTVGHIHQGIQCGISCIIQRHRNSGGNTRNKSHRCSRTKSCVSNLRTVRIERCRSA